MTSALLDSPAQQTAPEETTWQKEAEAPQEQVSPQEPQADEFVPDQEELASPPESATSDRRIPKDPLQFRLLMEKGIPILSLKAKCSSLRFALAKVTLVDAVKTRQGKTVTTPKFQPVKLLSDGATGKGYAKV